MEFIHRRESTSIIMVIVEEEIRNDRTIFRDPIVTLKTSRKNFPKIKLIDDPVHSDGFDWLSGILSFIKSIRK